MCFLVAGLNLTVALVAHVPEGTDWLALGLSAGQGGMKGMDVAMLWLNERSEEVRKIESRQQQKLWCPSPPPRAPPSHHPVWPGFA